MANIKTTIQRLVNAHERLRTWQAVADEIETRKGVKIPQGTLARICKSGGQYIPSNKMYLAALGLKRKPTPRAPRSLFDLSPAVLEWMLKHRA